MINPIRRNRNIGTANQGFGDLNRLVIPSPANESRSFFERLGKYNTVIREINGHKFRFVIERTRQTSFHACTVGDIAKVISHIPKIDIGDLSLVILRQPTRKEEILSPVWGRLIYSYEFENDYWPAVIIEATNLERVLKWSKRLCIEDQKELDLLKQDGHRFSVDKRHYTAEFKLENIRNTQLYRTLLHEFGHYVHYQKIVERPAIDDEPIEDWDKRADIYHNIPKREKEEFAHSYAKKKREELENGGVIPFEKIWDEDPALTQNIRLKDFGIS